MLRQTWKDCVLPSIASNGAFHTERLTWINFQVWNWFEHEHIKMSYLRTCLNNFFYVCNNQTLNSHADMMKKRFF